MITESFERRVSLPPSKIQCDWCCEMATSKIIDEMAYQGHQFACTMHGTEWYPHLFPESDAAPIESIIAEITGRVSLVKIHTDGPVPEWDLQERRVNGKGRTRYPWYPLVGHRSGLRANDMISLASALFILALEGGTAHMSPASAPQSN